MSFLTTMIVSAVVLGVAAYLAVTLIGGTIGLIALGVVAFCLMFGIGRIDRRRRGRTT